MTVGVLEGKYIVALRQRIEIGVIFEELLSHVAIKRLAAALVSKEQILRQSIGFIPCVGRVLMRAGAHFRA